MSAKMSPSRKAAKVSRSWVCLHRSTDPEFDAAARRAAFRDALRATGHQAIARDRARSAEGGGRDEDPRISRR